MADEADRRKLDRLEEVLRELRTVVVAFSGGADSALLAWVASKVLGRENALCLTAVSASLASWELEDVRRLADDWDLAWRPVETGELSDPQYVANGPDRCFHCKSHLMEALVPVARQQGAVVVLGVNTDDLKEHRPGQDAAKLQGARFPLVDAGLDKAAVRSLSSEIGLRTWDKPAAACLASRIPAGTAVTSETLSRVSRAEAGLRQLGFAQVRVRHYGDVARVELDTGALGRALEMRSDVVAAVKRAGYRWVTLDLEGFRSGNLDPFNSRHPRPPAHRAL
ncbi:MAG: ATP-dependent sacrificial sulfur transferase LarE [Actinomycetota bacterium]|nr:ATP-dependent sacrificial sulfur transferase LarE [Actinomycetota bacterium]